MGIRHRRIASTLEAELDWVVALGPGGHPPFILLRAEALDQT
jgi:hypothetical protein